MNITIGISILIWTFISIGWFLINVNKNKEEGWIDWILLIPALIIAYVIDAVGSVIGRFKGSD